MASGLKFLWDPRKAIANKAKHGVSFEEASQVFGDKIAITIQDPDHGSENEYREITIGTSGKFRIVVGSCSHNRWEFSPDYQCT